MVSNNTISLKVNQIFILLNRGSEMKFKLLVVAAMVAGLTGCSMPNLTPEQKAQIAQSMSDYMAASAMGADPALASSYGAGAVSPEQLQQALANQQAERNAQIEQMNAIRSANAISDMNSHLEQMQMDQQMRDFRNNLQHDIDKYGY